MHHRVLVAYATDGGGTARVAQAIGGALREAGVDADVSGVTFARRLDRYDAVIVGSPHRLDSWHPDATTFLKRHRRALASRPVWLFHIGSALTDESSRLPADVMRQARRIGALGVLNLMAPPGDETTADATMAGGITNLDAITPLASFVVQMLAARHAI